MRILRTLALATVSHRCIHRLIVSLLWSALLFGTACLVLALWYCYLTGSEIAHALWSTALDMHTKPSKRSSLLISACLSLARDILFSLWLSFLFYFIKYIFFPGLFFLSIPLPPLRTNHLAVGHLIQRDPPPYCDSC